jgi:hypothetical protein
VVWPTSGARALDRINYSPVQLAAVQDTHMAAVVTDDDGI